MSRLHRYTAILLGIKFLLSDDNISEVVSIIDLAKTDYVMMNLALDLDLDLTLSTQRKRHGPRRADHGNFGGNWSTIFNI